ncbi:pyrimidine reductase family protein [Nonomuraea sp. NBC_01738]|uniref:pyrimidine reductase family protein n=1 Tax=Nonomuraea sp. NBC_01738 TaxID=2976003 RepID=UPI002E0F52B1|nr:pyrimidine reductase family protein [Nonomuraea sp. NBC_01738]
MRRIYPDIEDDPDIAEAYAYPADRPWLRVNMVASADGGAWVKGLSSGLSSKGDRRVFGVLRGLADVVVAGAATVRMEGYGPAKRRPAREIPPPVAVVTGSMALDLGSPLFTEAVSRTIILTCASAPEDRRAEAAEVADVVVAGEAEVDLALAVRALHERGLTRVLCEGGPRLNAQLATDGLLDELCLTVSPLLVGGAAARILNGAASQVPLRLAQVLEEEGVLFNRYVKE